MKNGGKENCVHAEALWGGGPNLVNKVKLWCLVDSINDKGKFSKYFNKCWKFSVGQKKFFLKCPEKDSEVFLSPSKDNCPNVIFAWTKKNVRNKKMH